MKIWKENKNRSILEYLLYSLFLLKRKNMLRKILSCICSAMVIICLFPNFNSVMADETSSPKDDEPELFEVYDGYGNKIYEANSIEEAENYIFYLKGKTKSNSDFKKLVQFFVLLVTTTQTYTTGIAVIYKAVQWAQNEAEFVDVLDEIVPYSTLKEMFTSGKRGYLYGVDEVNPYPPHSYQGAMWLKSVTYYVIG